MVRVRGLLGPWIELFRSLGQAYLDLLAAEWAEVRRGLAASGKRVLWAAIYLGAAATVAFWLVALALFLLVAVLHVWLPWWGAAAVVTGVVLLATAVLGWLGMRKLKRVENPVSTVTRRVDDHLDWWEGHLLAGEGGAAPRRAGGKEERR